MPEETIENLLARLERNTKLFQDALLTLKQIIEVQDQRISNLEDFMAERVKRGEPPG
jgi:hypothetical protein